MPKRISKPKGEIVMAPSDTVDQYEQIAVAFLSRILDVDYYKCFISDESTLHDFASCGLPDAPQFETLEETYDYWDAWVIPRINETYGIEVKDTRARLIDIFRMIETVIKSKSNLQ